MQSFSIAGDDVDDQLIDAYPVMKFAGATDTRLARHVKFNDGNGIAAEDQIEPRVKALEMPNVTCAWTQLSGPAVEILNANSAPLP